MVIAGRATKCAVYACVARAAVQTTSRHGPRKTDGGALLQVSNAHFKQSERRARQLGRIAQTSPWIAVHFDRCFGALHTRSGALHEAAVAAKYNRHVFSPG